ncbi:MAG: ATP-binding protein [Bacteroidetes bacterium]|nr:ATP-binding protein [Bacteroidota bacterium]MCH8325343.1 ATP-binding protein [Bacteroidota bacterium]
MKITTNPFAFGKVVKGKQFFNRRKEIDEISTEIINHQNIILYAPRRYGKTSLVLKTFDELKKKHKNFVGLYIDFYNINSVEKFINVMSNQYAEHSKLTLEKLLLTLRNFLTGITPGITLDKDGNPKIELSILPNKRVQAFEDVMKLPKKLSEENKTVAVFFDEFQEVINLNGFDFQKKLRTLIQHHDKVSYVFCGSKHHLFQDIFNNSNNPLFKIGKTKYLDVIQEKEYSIFIHKNFIKINKEFKKEHAIIIYQLAGSVPYNIQLLCNEIFNLMLINNNVPINELINYSYKNIINSKNEEYIILYENFSRSVRLALEIIIKNDGKNLFRKDLLSDNRVAPSTLKKAINNLMEEGIIYAENKHYFFCDVFLRKWLKIGM